MDVIDLTAEHEELYCQCLEDWSDDIREAGSHKARWVDRMKERGIRVKLALDDRGVVGGMIQYLPIEESFAEGRDLYFILCVWVHGHKQGRGSFQRRGMGKALLQAAEEDARSRGARGMAAWGLWIPVWMRASWFRKHGYRAVDRDGIRVLLWKPFVEDAVPPRWIRQKRRPEPQAGKVVVTGFLNGWCPAQNLTFERGKRACAEVGGAVEFREVDTSERETLLEWGIADALFVNGKSVNSGPPPSYDKIRRLVEKSARRCGG